RRMSEPSVQMPPQATIESPSRFEPVRVLPVMVVRRTVAEASPWTWMPPDVANVSTSLGNEADRSTLLSLIRLLSIVSVPATVVMPPPSAKRPLGALAVARLPVTALCVSVSVPKARLRIPPPTALLANPEAPSARLPLTRVWSSVSVPSLEIPPPPASANGQHGSSDSIATLGAALLPRRAGRGRARGGGAVAGDDAVAEGAGGPGGRPCRAGNVEPAAPAVEGREVADRAPASDGDIVDCHRRLAGRTGHADRQHRAAAF